MIDKKVILIEGEYNVDLLNGHKIIFRSLRYRNYRLFFTGQTLSLVGTWIQQIAMPWLVYRLTGSELLLGAVGFASQIPAFLLAPLAGTLSDRWNRYYILLITQTLAMLQAFALGLLYFTGNIQVWQILLLASFMGLINAFDMPTRQAFVVQMVENRDDLSNAIALNSIMFNTARLIGPTIAGLVIAAANEGICFILNGISFLFVIGSLLMMKISPQKSKPAPTRVLHEFKEGLSYAIGFKPIRYIMLLLSLVSLVGMPYSVLMPVFASKILHGGPHTFGFLMAAAGTGALTGAVYLASRKSVLGLGRIIPLSTALFGAGLVAFSLSRVFWLSLPLVFITGLGMITQMAASNTIIQTIVDDDKRGRIMSFYVMAFIGTAPFGSLMAGVLASNIGAPNTLIICGALCVVGAGLFARKLPDLRKIVHPVYARLGIIGEVSSGIQTAVNLTTPPER
ncbi:MAG: MFS transporter [Sedimentisphaerales bacterium]|nr:MFS transporter [Sedimentisphaerales bacterium]